MRGCQFCEKSSLNAEIDSFVALFLFELTPAYLGSISFVFTINGVQTHIIGEGGEQADHLLGVLIEVLSI